MRQKVEKESERRSKVWSKKGINKQKVIETPAGRSAIQELSCPISQHSTKRGREAKSTDILCAVTPDLESLRACLQRCPDVLW